MTEPQPNETYNDGLHDWIVVAIDKRDGYTFVQLRGDGMHLIIRCSGPTVGGSKEWRSYFGA